jgi:hypothetical protein
VTHQGPERLGKVLRAWHGRVFDENREHWEVLLQSGRNFSRDPVIGIVESSLPGFVGCIQPIWTDQHDDCISRVHRLVDYLFEVCSAFYTFDISEDTSVSEVVTQRVGETSCHTLRIAASIANEDFA